MTRTKNVFRAKGSPLRVLGSQLHIGVQLQLYASVPQLFSHNPCGTKKGQYDGT